MFGQEKIGSIRFVLAVGYETVIFRLWILLPIEICHVFSSKAEPVVQKRLDFVFIWIYARFVILFFFLIGICSCAYGSMSVWYCHLQMHCKKVQRTKYLWICQSLMMYTHVVYYVLKKPPGTWSVRWIFEKCSENCLVAVHTYIVCCLCLGSFCKRLINWSTRIVKLSKVWPT